MKKLQVNLTPMTTCVLSYVMQIENQSFDQPWDEAQMRDCIKARTIDCQVACLPGSKVIVGFLCAEMTKKEVVLWNLAVHEDWRYKRIGSQLIDHAKDLMTPARSLIVAEIRERNIDGQLFLQRMGFKCTRIEKDGSYDPDGRWPTEDAYRFEFTNAADEACRGERGRGQKARGNR